MRKGRTREKRRKRAREELTFSTVTSDLALINKVRNESAKREYAQLGGKENKEDEKTTRTDSPSHKLPTPFPPSTPHTPTIHELHGPFREHLPFASHPRECKDLSRPHLISHV